MASHREAYSLSVLEVWNSRTLAEGKKGFSHLPMCARQQQMLSHRTKDQSCVEVCPVDCIYDGGDQFLINPEECIDCGACEPECPVEAIYPEDEVPEDMKS